MSQTNPDPPAQRPEPFSPIEVVRDWSGEELTPASTRRMLDAPSDQLLAFAEHYVKTHEEAVAAPVSPSVRPSVFCSINSPVDDLYDEELLPLRGARVRALSLLANTVCLADPLLPLARRTAHMGPNGEPPRVGEWSNALTSLTDLVPLADAGAVVFSLSPRPNAGAEPWRDLIGPALRVGDEELDLRWMTDPHRVRGDASPMLAAMNMLGDVIEARQAAPAGAVFIGTPLERSMLIRLFDLAGSAEAIRGRRMADLATLAVPVLIPEASTVVAARDADAYHQLRKDLADALDFVQALPSSNEDWLAEARQVTDEELGPGREKVEAEIKSSRFLRGLRQAATGFGISALGASAGTAAGGTLGPSLSAASVAALGNALVACLAYRKQAASSRAVLESYLMFGGPSRVP
jgi:hypothetical protein